MTRTVTVTGGFSGVITVDLTDQLKTLQSVSSFRLALCPVGQDDPPVFDSPVWEAATGTPTAGAAVLSLTVDGTTATGFYNVAYDVEEGGRHEADWVMDRRNARRRALLKVT